MRSIKLTGRQIAITIMAFIAMLMLLSWSGCRKKTTSPSQSPTSSISTPNTIPSGVVDVQWKPVLTGYIELMFASDGTYYESNMNNQGTWKFGSPDSIKIQKQFYKVNYKIISITADTLKLMDAAHFVNTYHK